MRGWLILTVFLWSCQLEVEGDNPLRLEAPDASASDASTASIDNSSHDELDASVQTTEIPDSAAFSGGDSESASDAARVTQGCDPVANTGCLDFLGQQCVVDRGANQAAGICVFASAMPPATGCAEDIFSSSCPPGRSCIRGSCRALCLSNTDCKTGECCAELASDKPGNPLKTCGPCP